MIAVVDSGGANLASVLHALGGLGVPAELSADPERIARAEKVLLPGVGAAPRAMQLMRERGLIDCVRQRQRPVLGICLGMQLLFERSEEGAEKGHAPPIEWLALIPGQVRRFAAQEGLTIPHMGWNQIHRVRGRESRLLSGIADGTNFYFVHSYRAPLGPDAIAACEHGERFAAVVERGPFLGVQFHPERSGAPGARLLQNFVDL